MSVTAARWEALMRSVEGPYAAAVRAEKNRYISEAAAVFPVTGKLEEKLFDYHAAAMVEIALQHQGKAVRLALGATFNKKSLRIKADWEKLWLYLLQQWTAEYGAQAARETAQTTRNDMQQIVAASLSHQEEFNPVAVAQKLLMAKDLSAPRAEVIAVTETHNAMMFASLEGSKKLQRDEGLEFKKKWVPVLDERTRANHASMSGHAAIPLEADFNVGGVRMSRPGDPRGGPSNCIRCRCVLAYEVIE